MTSFVFGFVLFGLVLAFAMSLPFSWVSGNSQNKVPFLESSLSGIDCLAEEQSTCLPSSEIFYPAPWSSRGNCHLSVGAGNLQETGVQV